MLREGFPRRSGARDGVEECRPSRLLMKGMDLDVAILLRPFDPGDGNVSMGKSTTKRLQGSAKRVSNN